MGPAKMRLDEKKLAKMQAGLKEITALATKPLLTPSEYDRAREIKLLSYLHHRQLGGGSKSAELRQAVLEQWAIIDTKNTQAFNEGKLLGEKPKREPSPAAAIAEPPQRVISPDEEAFMQILIGSGRGKL